MKRKYASLKQIVDIYNLRQSGKNNAYIAKLYDYPKSRVMNIFYRLKRDIKLAEAGKLEIESNYSKAVTIIKGTRKLSPLAQEIEEEFVKANELVEVKKNNEDRYSKLNNSFENFQKAISDFIAEEVSHKTKEVVAKLESEKAMLEKDKNDMKQLMEIAKHDNWIENLKKRFN